MDDKHILVSLGDDKVKQIGEVIGNKTCNKILDLLAVEELTVTDISEKLKIPLNTADYNIKKLVKSGLIEKASHFWSIKGKRMPVYRVSNRKIIISPKKSINKIFAWTLGLTGLSALTIREFTKNTSGATFEAAPMMFRSVPNELAADVALMAKEPVIESMADVAIQTISTPKFATGLHFDLFYNVGPGAWFLFGAWFAIFLFFAFTIYNERRARGPRATKLKKMKGGINNEKNR